MYMCICIHVSKYRSLHKEALGASAMQRCQADEAAARSYHPPDGGGLAFYWYVYSIAQHSRAQHSIV